MENDVTRIPVTTETRDEILKPRKRGDETYDELLRRLVDDDGGPTATLDIDSGELAEMVANSLADEVDIRIGVDSDELAQAIAGRVDAHQLDEDRVIEALRSEVRDAIQEAIREVAGTQV